MAADYEHVPVPPDGRVGDGEHARLEHGRGCRLRRPGRLHPGVAARRHGPRRRERRRLVRLATAGRYAAGWRRREPLTSPLKPRAPATAQRGLSHVYGCSPRVLPGGGGSSLRRRVPEPTGFTGTLPAGAAAGRGAAARGTGAGPRGAGGASAGRASRDVASCSGPSSRDVARVGASTSRDVLARSTAAAAAAARASAIRSSSLRSS